MIPNSILRGFVLISLFTLAALSVFRMPRVPQSQEYLQFAGSSVLLILSNVFFLLAGLQGVFLLKRKKDLPFLDQTERRGYFLLFFGLVATALGSAVFHAHVNLETLVWDRIPIVVVFVTFYSLVVYERVSPRWGKATFFVFLIYAAGSVIYWYFSEKHGNGDLRPYILVQLFAMTTLPILLAFFPPRYDRVRDLVGIMVAYGLAKVTENFDREIYHFTGDWLSGHTLKHLLAGAGTLIWVQYLKRRGVLQNLYPKYF